MSEIWGKDASAVSEDLIRDRYHAIKMKEMLIMLQMILHWVFLICGYIHVDLCSRIFSFCLSDVDFTTSWKGDFTEKIRSHEFGLLAGEVR